MQVTDKQPKGGFKTTRHTNNGLGYPFGDVIPPQYNPSCQIGSPIGLLNLTVAVSNYIFFYSVNTYISRVLDSANITQLSGSVEVVTTDDPNVPAARDTYMPRVNKKPLIFKKMKDIYKSGYTFYTAQHTWDPDFYQKHYDVQGSNGERTFQSLFNFADVLPECKNSQ